MKKQRVLAVILGLCLSVAQLPMTAFAEEADTLDLQGVEEAVEIKNIAIERDSDVPDASESVDDSIESSEEDLIEDEIEGAEEVEEDVEDVEDVEDLSDEAESEEIMIKETKLTSSDGSAVRISTADGLEAIRDNPNGNFILTADIDLSDNTTWIPIGGNGGAAFSGVFDGDGHKIVIGKVSGTSYDNYGLFGNIDKATIKNLDVQIEVTGGKDVGVIAGSASGSTIEACSASGNIMGSSDVGGLVGYIYNCQIRNCYSTATVTGTSSSGNDGVGGLVGSLTAEYRGNISKIISCYSLGEVKKDNTTSGIGGLIGRRQTWNSGDTAVLFSFYGETGPSDETNGFGVLNDELQDPATFVGWDFDNVWALDGTHDGYPYLKRTGEYKTFTLQGKGSEDDPYIVTNEEELAAIARGEIGTDTYTYSYMLANDITLTATYWTPIGGNGMPSFEGTFDGNNYKITNLKIGAVGYSDQGLFGNANNATIKNLDLVNADIYDSNSAGILAGGAAYSDIEACSSSGKISGKSNIGGLVGSAYNTTIRNSYSVATVEGTSTSSDYGVGGLVGYLSSEFSSNYGKVVTCYAAGAVSKATTANVGGLVGRTNTWNSGHTVIFDSYFSGRTGQSDKYRGFSVKHDKLKNRDTFVYWDFENVWTIDASTNGGLPTLSRIHEYTPVKLSGQGTVKSPFIIKSEQDLASVARGEAGAVNYTAYYKLNNDITITSEYWTPIGGNGADGFNGHFNGQGHTISGLTIAYPGYAKEGLFGEGTPEISNLILDEVNISGAEEAGALISNIGSGGTIKYCASFGTISGALNVGGLAATAYNAEISNTFSRVAVTGTSEGTCVGGLVGVLMAEFRDTTGIIKDSFAAGKLSKTAGTSNIGGLAGSRRLWNTGNNVIVDSFYDKEITGVNETTSGLAVSTEVMKDASTYTYWDFENVWAISNDKNSGYPYLKFAGEYQVALPEGTGVELDPYIIETENELAALAKGELQLNGYYELGKDIIITSDYWNPIGLTENYAFNGIFDGKNHTISGYKIETLGYDLEGLFGAVSGTVQNLRISGDIKSANTAGILASGLLQNGIIRNCATFGSITGSGKLGGLVAYCYNAKITDCYSRANVTSTSTDSGQCIGGLVGNSMAEYSSRGTVIENCYATGAIVRNAAAYGGLIGRTNVWNSGVNDIKNCYYDNVNDGATDRGVYVTTADMKKQSTYSGWDFTSTWSIASTENDGYPQLQAFAGSDIPSTSELSVTGVTISDESMALKVGEKSTLSATVLPANATNKKVSWSSSNTTIATVNSSGLVTALKAGTADITVTTEDGNKTATCKLTVSASDIKPTSISLSKTSASIVEGTTETLTVSYTPTDATIKDVTWNSSNTAVATVDTAGVVTAVAEGTATITATLTSDSTIYAACEVTVTKQAIATTGISLNKNTLTLEASKEETLAVAYEPANAIDREVEWSSSNVSVATVDTTGKVTAVAKGNAIITVALKSDKTKTATCQITVTGGSEPAPEPEKDSYKVKFYIDGIDVERSFTVDAGDSIADILDDNQDITELIPDGAIFAGWYIDGTSTLWDITAPVTKNLALEARYVLPDEEADSDDPGSGRDPSIITGDEDIIEATYYYDVYMVKGQSYTFPIKYADLDEDYENKTEKIKWVSSDPKTIKISGNYKAKANKATSTGDITVSDKKNLEESSYVYFIHIIEPSISAKSLSLIKGETAELSISGIDEEFKSYYDISWYSSNAEIARFDDGIVSAYGAGSAKISAFVNGKSYTCSVKVVNSKAPDKITSNTTIKLSPLQAATLKFKVSGFKASGLKWYDEEGVLLKAFDKKGYPLAEGETSVSYYQNDVVRITPSGKVTAVGTGSTAITAEDKNGTRIEVKVNVPEPVTNTIYLNTGKTKTLSYYNVKAKNASWRYKSDDAESIIFLNKSKGNVKALRYGKAQISCEYDPYDTGKPIVYSTNIFVEKPTLDTSNGNWSKINKSLTSATLTMNVGDRNVAKVNDIYQNAVFTSDKPTKVFVDEAGVISARSKGTANLTARVNGLKITIKVVVKE